jgi:ketosteroid isomerase-like protein
MSEDIEWQLPDMEGVPAGGTRRERAGAGEFFATIARDQEVQRFEPQQFVAQGDKVVALGQYAWRVKSTGREFKGDWAHVFTVRDGKIVKFQEYTDTAAAVAAYQPTRNG